jgi:DNA-binding transcriptional LysR family regulator
MNWDDLRTFLVAVRAGSYSAAARPLDVNRTTVGRRLASLEQSLGVSLFHETPFGPEPTPEGRLVLEAATIMDDAAQVLIQSLSSARRPPALIRIASSAGIAAEFMDDIRAFQESHPHIGMEFLAALDPVDAVMQRKADLAIAFIRHCPRRLSGVLVATANQAPYASRNVAEPRELPHIGWGQEMELAVPGQWTTSNILADRAAPSARVNDWVAMRQAVEAGLGWAWLWSFAADRDPGLVRLAPPDPRWDSPLWLLHRSTVPVGASLGLLVGYLQEVLPGRL